MSERRDPKREGLIRQVDSLLEACSDEESRMAVRYFNLKKRSKMLLSTGSDHPKLWVIGHAVRAAFEDCENTGPNCKNIALLADIIFEVKNPSD